MTQKKTNNVPNAVTGGVDIEVEGQKFTLLLSNRILMEIEDETNLNLSDPKLLFNPNRRQLTTLFKAMLDRAGAKLSFDQLLDICSGKNRGAIVAAICLAVGQALPTGDQVKLLDPTLAKTLMRAQEKAQEEFLANL